MAVISIYAPTMSHPPKEIENLYADLGNIVTNIPKEDKISILGNLMHESVPITKHGKLLVDTDWGNVIAVACVFLLFALNTILLSVVPSSNKKKNINPHGCTQDQNTDIFLITSLCALVTSRMFTTFAQ